MKQPPQLTKEQAASVAYGVVISATVDAPKFSREIYLYDDGGKVVANWGGPGPGIVLPAIPQEWDRHYYPFQGIGRTWHFRRYAKVWKLTPEQALAAWASLAASGEEEL